MNIFTRVDQLLSCSMKRIIHKEAIGDHKKVEDIFIESTHEKNENTAEIK